MHILYHHIFHAVLLSIYVMLFVLLIIYWRAAKLSASSYGCGEWPRSQRAVTATILFMHLLVYVPSSNLYVLLMAAPANLQNTWSVFLATFFCCDMCSGDSL